MVAMLAQDYPLGMHKRSEVNPKLESKNLTREAGYGFYVCIGLPSWDARTK